MTRERRAHGPASPTPFALDSDGAKDTSGLPGVGILDRQDVPELDSKISDAILAFGRSSRFVCRHVNEASRFFLCSQHPRLGLRCGRCLVEHLIRHARDEEFTCDRCRCGSETIHPVLLDAPLNVEVRQARGPRGLLVGRMFVIGLGLCPACIPDESVAA